MSIVQIFELGSPKLRQTIHTACCSVRIIISYKNGEHALIIPITWRQNVNQILVCFQICQEK